MPRPYEDGFPPYVSGSDTSYEAAVSVVTDTPTLRNRVEALVRERGGMTCDEIEDTWSWIRHQSASARIRELVLEERLVDTGVRRVTRSGRKAIVWNVRPSD